jgi:phosphate-selective porin OprO and OprP
MKQYPLSLALSVAAALTAGSAFAGTLTAPAPTGKSPVIEEKATDPSEKFWAWATLYKNDSNPFIQELSLTGRYHGQFAWADREDGTGSRDEDGWDHRRLRYGFRAKVLKDFEVKAEAFSLANDHDFYAGLTDAYIAWKPNDAFNLTVGKQKPKFSLDWTTSSREILTIERNILINNISPDYATGVSIAGKQGKWSYYGGAFNNDTFDAGDDDEFGDLDGGWSWIGSVGYDVADVLGTEKATLRFDYMHSEMDVNNDRFATFEDAAALSLALKQGQWGLNTEFIYAERGSRVANGDGDMWGFYIMPTYDINKKAQLVFRYTHAESDGDAISSQSRYERFRDISTPALANVRGDSYDAVYLGFNYYLCGHKLKFMSGLEYAEMDSSSAAGDFETLTWVNGIRLYW